jgi:hypothetical protein
MFFSIYAKRKFARLLAHNAGLGFVEKDGAHPHTTTTSIVMPPYPAARDDSDPSVKWWWYALIHEIAHNTGTNSIDISKVAKEKIDMRSFYGQALNIAMDHNIERKQYGQLQGVDKWMREGRDLHNAMVKQINEKQKSEYIKKGGEWPPKQASEKQQQESDAIHALYAFDHEMRKRWEGLAEEPLELLTKQEHDFFNTLMGSEELKELWLEKRNGGDHEKVLNKFMSLLNIDPEEKKKESQKQKQQGDGEGGEGEGEPQNGKGQGQNGEGEGQDGKGDKSKKGEGGDPAEGKFFEDFHNLNFDNHEARKGHSKSELYINMDSADFSRTDMSEYELKKKKTRNKGYAPNFNIDNTLPKKIAQLLKVYSQTKWQGGKKNGKINKRRLAKISIGQDNVFRKRIVHDVMDTTVLLLVDTSGSMGGMNAGEKYGIASRAAVKMSMCLRKLHIPHAVHGFTTGYGEHCLQLLHKDFNEKVTPEELWERLADVDMWGNVDSVNVDYAHDCLLNQKQKRRILIVLSDGQPVGGPNSPAMLKKVVGDIHNKSPVEVYGIGIKTDAVKRYYPDHVVLRDLSKLDSEILNLIKNKIMR